MGFGFKKSKNFGGFKVNLSKSGIGFSTGVKGFRVSAEPNGVNLNAGRNGIYYRKKLDSSNENNSQNIDIQNEPDIIKKDWDNFQKGKNFYKYGLIFAFLAFGGMFLNDMFILFAFPCVICILIALIKTTKTLMKSAFLQDELNEKNEIEE